MGGATHRDPWDKQGGAFFRGGGNGRTMHTNPLSRGEPIGWGAIKTHCTAMDSVAANRRLKSRKHNCFINLGVESTIRAQTSKISREKRNLGHSAHYRLHAEGVVLRKRTCFYPILFCFFLRVPFSFFRPRGFPCVFLSGLLLFSRDFRGSEDKCRRFLVVL